VAHVGARRRRARAVEPRLHVLEEQVLTLTPIPSGRGALGPRSA
jgi:hypothetical protein